MISSLRSGIVSSAVIKIQPAQVCKSVRSFSASRLHFSDESIIINEAEKPPGVEQLKVYTKTGDRGMTSTFTGERRFKDDKVFEVLGACDELTSVLGEFGLEKDHPYNDQLQRVQCILQDINACVATPVSSAREIHLKRTEFDQSHVAELEEWIDYYSNLLPPLENFILPGGGKASSTLHIARTVCRRAERALVHLIRTEQVSLETLTYLNRLSDFLFTVARYAAKLDARKENIYIRPGK